MSKGFASVGAETSSPGQNDDEKHAFELYETLRAGLELTETPVALLFRRSSPINGMATNTANLCPLCG
jgi:hypothetical protein